VTFAAALADRPHALVMGVINVTPDSFSDGSVHLDPEAAVKSAQNMLSEGAAILDVGGESTRPGADPVPPELEWTRVGPVIERLAGMPVGIDTRHAEPAERALDAGADGAEAGEDLARILEDGDVFDPALSWLVAHAAARGEAARALDDVASVYRQRLARGVDRVTTLVTPAAELVVGAAVCVFAYSYLIPMFEWANEVLGG